MKGFEKHLVETVRDHRGWVSNFLDFLPITTDNLKNVHIVSLAPGQTRGNHFHKKQHEALVVLGDEIFVRARNHETGEKYEETVGAERPVMFFVSPFVSHAFENRGEKMAYLVCFTDTVYDSDHPDSHPDSII